MQISQCPACGASVRPGATDCAYCHQFFQEQPTAARGPQEGGESPDRTSPARSIAFQQAKEPNEGAFTLLVPQGWLLEGGIRRADHMSQVVSAQSIEAKLDLTVKRDAAGSVQIRWCPDIKYCDMRMSPAGMMGFFPPGSNYQGMIVLPLMPPHGFITQVVFPWAHPEAGQIQVVAQDNMPLLAQMYKERMAALRLPTPFAYEGGTVTFQYEERGTRFLEKAYAVIENLGPQGGGMWGNHDTLLVRAPQDEFETWEPALHFVRQSVKLDLHWVAQEAVSQEFLSRSFLNAQQAAQARDRRILEVQRQLQDLDRQIVDHRARTNAEISNDQYLTLMNQEEYVNPYTNEIDIGSDQWDHRWVNESGDQFYTDNEDDDPNIPGELNRTDWRRTQVRPRFPQ